MGNGLKGPVAVKIEPPEEVPHFLLAGRGGHSQNVLCGGGLQVQRIKLVLSEVAELEVVTGVTLATQQGQFTGKGFYQTGLTGAVGAQQANTGLGQNPEIHLTQDAFVAVADISLTEVDQRAGHFPRRREPETERRVDMGRSDFLHPLNRLQAALGLPGFIGLGAKTAHIGFHMRNLLLLLFEGRVLLSELLRPLVLIGGIVTHVQVQFGVFQGHNAVDHIVQKVPVVRDDDQCARIALQPLLQPQGRVQVQVVGGLVQQQQIRGTHQCLSQVQANAPTAGKVRHWAITIPGSEPEAGKQLLSPGGCRVGLNVFHFGVQPGQSLTIVMGGLDGRLQTPQFGIAVEDIIFRPPVQGFHFLGHMRDAPLARNIPLAAVGLQAAQKQLKEAGLAAAIGANEARLLAGEKGEVRVIEQKLPTALQGNLL